MKAKNIRIIKTEGDPETPELLASSLIEISNAFQKLGGQGNLTNDAIAALIKNMRGCGHLNKEDITFILDNLPKLKGYYIRK